MVYVRGSSISKIDLPNLLFDMKTLINSYSTQLILLNTVENIRLFRPASRVSQDREHVPQLDPKIAGIDKGRV
jgi:hypothetical protein